MKMPNFALPYHSGRSRSRSLHCDSDIPILSSHLMTSLAERSRHLKPESVTMVRMTDSQPLVVAFDLDDTLAPSKSPVHPRVAEQLVDLARRVEVAIISGGQIGQFRSQVVDNLPDAGTALSHIHLLPTCGTAYYRHSGEDFTLL